MLQEYNYLKQQLIKKEFEHLNSAQLKAALTSRGALLILAGAGSGKTTTVISRIAYLLKYGSAYDESLNLPACVDENFIAYMKSFVDFLPTNIFLILLPKIPWPPTTFLHLLLQTKQQMK